jgi:type I restriction enzyme S subunit
MGLKGGYRQGEVSEIPEDWKLVRVGEAGEVLGGRQRSPHHIGQLTKYLRVANVFDGFIDTEDVLEMPFSEAEKQRFKLRDGDILLNEGQSIDLVGRSAIYRGEPEDCCFQNTLVRFRARNAACPEFVQFVFQKYLGAGTFASIALQTTSIAHLGSGRLAALKIPFPPKAEQEAIAEALSDADALIKSLEQLLAKKRQILQGTVQELLTGKRRLPGFGNSSGYKQTEVGLIPEDWEVLVVRNLVSQGPQNGYSGRSGDDAKGTLTMSLAATSSGRLTLVENTVKRLEKVIPSSSPLFLKPFDVLVQRSNTIDLVGTTVVFDGPATTYVYPDLMMRLRFKTHETGQWFWRYANSFRGRSFFRSIAAGSTGSMPKISGEKLRAMPLPVPSSAEQAAITSILSDMDAEITALESKLAKARQIKQGMMQELLTGRIRLV